MAVYLLGGGGGHEPPFSRSFFNTTLGDILSKNGKDRAYTLTLYLVDGTTQEVCEIVDLAEAFMSVRAFNAADDTCETSLNIIPYGAIYRLQLSPKKEDTERVGFHWTPSPQKALKAVRKK